MSFPTDLSIDDPKVDTATEKKLQGRAELRKKSLLLDRPYMTVRSSLQACRDPHDNLICLQSLYENHSRRKDLVLTQKLSGLVDVLEHLLLDDNAPTVVDSPRGQIQGFIPFNEAFELYSAHQEHPVDIASFRDSLLHPVHGLSVNIIHLKDVGERYIILKSNTFNYVGFLSSILSIETNKPARFDPLVKENVQTIMSTLDTEWDKTCMRVILGSTMSRTELNSVGVDSDIITRDTQRVMAVAEEVSNATIAATDMYHLSLEAKKTAATKQIMTLKDTIERKKDIWTADQLHIFQNRIDSLTNTLEDIESHRNPQTKYEKQKSASAIKRKADFLIESERLKKRRLTNQGRAKLLDSDDESFIAKCVEDKSTYHGRRHDVVMYTNRRVKSRDLLNIANYRLALKNKKLIKSATTVYNRARPRNIRSLQAKQHRGKGLFCFKKPPKTEDSSNENTHYQRAHIKNIKMRFFSEKNKGARDFCFMRSIDDKAYLRPGTSEGFEKTRNKAILTLTDVDQAKKLPKYDWPEKEVYITPSAHRIFNKRAVTENGTEHLLTDDDNHFVIVRPKAIIGSSGTVWASETQRLRHTYPDIFEVQQASSPKYSQGFRSVCARLHDDVALYSQMTEEEDVKKVTSNEHCRHRKYEVERLEHLQHRLETAIAEVEIHSDMHTDEKQLLATRVLPVINQICSSASDILFKLNKLPIKTEELLPASHQMVKLCTTFSELLDDLCLPKVKPNWADLTDAGPGVGVSNLEVRFREAELAMLHDSNYRIRCHRSRGDSGQGEAERTNSAIGDAVVDGSTIHWEKLKRFEGMSEEEIANMSVGDYESHEKGRMQRNAWIVADEVCRRIDGAPVLHEFIKAHVSETEGDLFFFSNSGYIHDYAKRTSFQSRRAVPGSAYMEKVFSLIENHFHVGELFMEYLKQGCLEKGNMCTFCSDHPLTGPQMERIPQPIPDPNRPYHFRNVFDTTNVNEAGQPRQADDWQPRVNITKLFRIGQLSLDNSDSIRETALKYAVEEEHVISCLQHLTTLKQTRLTREGERKKQQQEKKEKQ